MKELALNYREMAAGNIVMQTDNLQQDTLLSLHILHSKSFPECVQWRDAVPLQGTPSYREEFFVFNFFLNCEIEKVIVFFQRRASLKTMPTIMSDHLIPFPCQQSTTSSYEQTQLLNMNGILIIYYLHLISFFPNPWC